MLPPPHPFVRKIRTIRVDDERIGRSRLRRMLENEPDIDILAECADGNSALEAVHAHLPDLLFLDINMPGMDGFAVLDALGVESQPAAVVFVTAYDAHAVRAFDACALDYLLKPASQERLARALSRARTRLFAGLDAAAAVSSLSAAPAAESARFVVRSGGRVSFIAPSEIEWVEAAGNYAILHSGKHNHMMRETMSGLEAQLPAAIFMRVSRSAILNLRHVKELQASALGDAAILADGQRIHVTRSLREIAKRLSRL